MLDRQIHNSLRYFNTSHYIKYCMRIVSLLKVTYTSRLELE